MKKEVLKKIILASWVVVLTLGVLGYASQVESNDAGSGDAKYFPLTVQVHGVGTPQIDIGVDPDQLGEGLTLIVDEACVGENAGKRSFPSDLFGSIQVSGCGEGKDILLEELSFQIQTHADYSGDERSFGCVYDPSEIKKQINGLIELKLKCETPLDKRGI